MTSDNAVMRETEARHAVTADLDLLGSRELVHVLTATLADVPALVALAAAETAAAVDGAEACLRRGGRLVFIGSGTPGRLVEADASELFPTFGFPASRLVVIRAGADVQRAGGPAEDRPELATEQMARLKLSGDDVVVAVASSGSTPFTMQAARCAAASGAFVIVVANVPDPPMATHGAVTVVLRTRAEPVAGSTRMRAGLAQRMWLTVFSTAVMCRLGLVFDNLMVNVVPSLDKLRSRQVAILQAATGQTEQEAAEALADAGGVLPLAVVTSLAGVGTAEAAEALAASGGVVRAAIERALRQ